MKKIEGKSTDEDHTCFL